MIIPLSGLGAHLIFSLLTDRLNQGGKFRAIVYYAPVTLLSQDSEDGLDPHPNLHLLLARDDLAGYLRPLVQLDYGQIVGG